MGSGEDAAGKKLSALDELITLPHRFENPYIREWKQGGGRVFGYTCSYVPEEILYALEGVSKIMALRLGAQGCRTTEDADIHMHKFMCSYCRSLIQLGIQGEYRFLDGVIVANGCEPMRRTRRLWRDVVGIPFVGMLSVPHATQGENRVKWYRDELSNLISDISEIYASRVTQDSLRRAIKTCNVYRRLVHELYDLRTMEKPKLTGSEALRITQAGVSMPKQTFIEKLTSAIADLKQRPGIDHYGARIMIAGSYMDDPFLIDIIESTGAIVVTDSLCSGRKSIEGLVDEDIDPLEAITDRYLNRVACPRMIDGATERIEFVKKLARGSKVDGVIFQRLAFCDGYGVENIMESKALAAEGIATMELEREYLATDKGRFKTRVQAFIEKIGK